MRIFRCNASRKSAITACTYIIPEVVPDAIPVAANTFRTAVDLWCGEIWGSILAEGKSHHNTASVDAQRYSTPATQDRSD